MLDTKISMLLIGLLPQVILWIGIYKYGETDNLLDIQSLGCGDLQYIIESEKDIESAKELIKKAYNEN